MNRKPLFNPAVLCSLLLSLQTACRAERSIPQPAVLPDSLITLSIPDIQQTLDDVQTLLDQILPADARLDVRAKIGEAIGDPQLKVIPPGKGGAVVWNGTLWYAALACDPVAGTKIADLFTDAPLLHAQDEGVLFLAKQPAGLRLAESQWPLVSEQLLARQQTGAFIQMQVADLVEKFRPQINMIMMMMPGMMTQSAAQLPEAQAKSMQSMGKFVEGEMRVLVSIASQIDSLEVALLPSKTGVEISHIFAAKAGTPLQELLSSPDSITPDPAISTALLEPGMMAIEMHLGNPQAMRRFIEAEAASLIKEMAMDPAKASTWTNLVSSWTALMNGSIAETFSMSAEEGYRLSYIGHIQDQDALLALLAAIPDQMAPLMKLYEGLGMPMHMDLKLNTRRYKDFAVHQYDFNYKLDKMDPNMAAQFETMKLDQMNSELTLADNKLLWTMGTPSLDELIDRVQAGKKIHPLLHARKVYPAGGILYYDIDIGAYMGFLAAMTPTDPPQKMFNAMAEALKGSTPLIGAAFKHENRMQISTTLPTDLLKQLGLFWGTASQPRD